MADLLAWWDSLATTDDAAGMARWLDRGAFLFVTLMVLSSPHSIAATNISFGIAMAMFLLRLALSPRRFEKPNGVEIGLAILFLWSVVTALTSYDPQTSINRLKGPVMFVIVILVFRVAKTRRSALFLVSSLIVSSTVLALMAPIYRMVGRGVEIYGVAPTGALGKSALADGDQLLRVNGRRLSDPAELIVAVESGEPVNVQFHRADWYSSTKIEPGFLGPGETPAERLGISEWRRGHYWRSSGFFSHYTTFAEYFQLIASLIFGILLILLIRGNSEKSSNTVFRVPILAGCLSMAILALLLSGTRASQLSFGISSICMILLSVRRKAAIAAVLVAIPIAIGAVLLIQSTRNVGFFDTQDSSNTYRMTMWRDGIRIWTESPRNFVFGVGMDSIKSHWKEWGMYDGGRLFMGHFHNMPIQLVVERGLPALLIWLSLLFVFLRSLWRSMKGADVLTHGVLLGSLGGTIGFFTSGVFHNNLGDAEVAIVFFIIIGIASRLVAARNRELLPSELS